MHKNVQYRYIKITNDFNSQLFIRQFQLDCKFFVRHSKIRIKFSKTEQEAKNFNYHSWVLLHTLFNYYKICST